MRISIVLYTLLLLQQHSVGQSKTNNTKIHIIGVIHTGTQYFGSHELLKKFERIDPDIVLWEQSIPFKKVFGLRTAKFLKIWRPGIEQLALQKYTSQKEDFKVLPFDTVILNRKEYIKSLQQNTEKVFNLLLSTRKNEKDSVSLEGYLTELNSYNHEIRNKSLEEINHDRTVNRSRNLYKLEDSIIARQLIKYSNDTALNKWYIDNRNFWTARNTYMTEQIEKVALANPGKTIIVLTGLNHKYFLVDRLKNRREIMLMEIN